MGNTKSSVPKHIIMMLVLLLDYDIRNNSCLQIHNTLPVSRCKFCRIFNGVSDQFGIGVFKTQLISPSAAYMHRWTGSTLVQVMACRLFGTKPLPEPMQTLCQLDPQEQTSVKFESKCKIFHWWYCIWNGRQRNGDHIVSLTWWYSLLRANIVACTQASLISDWCTLLRHTTSFKQIFVIWYEFIQKWVDE